MQYRRFSRHFHLWAALAVFVPVVIVIVSGLLLQVKKEVAWVQPPTQRGEAPAPSLSFEQVLSAAKQVPQAQVQSWDDIDRLDVRPDKGIIKVRTNNGWEVQMDAANAEIKQVAYRRSDVIEAIHDGSWFFEGAKLWLFLPAAIILFCMWISGGVLLFTTLRSKYKKRRFQQSR